MMWALHLSAVFGLWCRSERKTMDPNHDIVPTLRMFGGLMTDAAADEILRLRARADAVDAYLRSARRLYFIDVGHASTPMAIFFNDALAANGTYEADHGANDKREQAARDKLPRYL